MVILGFQVSVGEASSLILVACIGWSESEMGLDNIKK